MSSPLGGYIGPRPDWSPGRQSGVFDINDRFAGIERALKTVTVAAGATVLDSISMADPCLIRSVRLSRAGWIRFYDSDAARFQDAARLVTSDPISAAGIHLEVRTSGDQTVNTAPAVYITNRQLQPGQPYPIRLTNESLLPDIEVEVTFIPLLATT